MKKFVHNKNSDLSSSRLIVSLCSIFAPSLYLILPKPFAVSHRPEPPSCITSHSLILHQETISLLQNHTPQNHIGYTLRSPISTDLCRILGTSPGHKDFKLNEKADKHAKCATKNELPKPLRHPLLASLGVTKR